MNFIAIFETESGKEITKNIGNHNDIEDATIEASNIADENGYELLEVDYENRLC